MTEYVPNISIPQKRVKILMPSNSKLSKSTKPKTAQNSVCIVSNKLRENGRDERKNGKKTKKKVMEHVLQQSLDEQHSASSVRKTSRF